MCAQAEGRAEGGRIISRLQTVSVEPDAGLDLMTVPSWPEQKSSVSCLTDWATQAPHPWISPPASWRPYLGFGGNEVNKAIFSWWLTSWSCQTALFLSGLHWCHMAFYFTHPWIPSSDLLQSCLTGLRPLEFIWIWLLNFISQSKEWLHIIWCSWGRANRTQPVVGCKAVNTHVSTSVGDWTALREQALQVLLQT